MEEDRKAKLPKNFEEKQYWAQYALDEEKKAKQARDEGRDYDVSEKRSRASPLHSAFVEVKKDEFNNSTIHDSGSLQMEKLRGVSAEEADRLDRAKKRKRNPDQGFSSFEAATARQYHNLVDQIKPDMEDYEAKKEKMGASFFPTANTMIHGTHKDSPEALER